LAHNIDIIHHMFIPSLPDIANELIVGTLCGVVVLFVVNGVKKLFKKNRY
jgi:uncharacterized protein